MNAIDSRNRAASTVFRRFGLAPFRKIIPPDIFEEAARKAHCAPKRERLLVPEVVAWLMMYVGLQTTSMTQGLCQAWGLMCVACPWLNERCVTEEAFCQARKQLTIGFWQNVWEHLGSRFEATFAQSLLWKNTFRLLAVDGSDVDLPNAAKVARFFGRSRNQRGEGRQPQAKIVSLCSVFTGFCFAFKLIGKPFTEHQALKHLMRHLRHNDLVLMDRGFFSLCSHLAHSSAWSAFPHSPLRSAYRVYQTPLRPRGQRVGC